MYMPHDVLRRRPRRRKRFRSAEAGQGLVEYALLLVLVGLVVIIILSNLGQSVSNVFENITCNLSTEPGCRSEVAMVPDDSGTGGSGAGSGAGTGGSDAGSGTGGGSGAGTGGSGAGSGTGGGSGAGTGGSGAGSGTGGGSGTEIENHHPEFETITNPVVNEGQTVTVTFSAQDADDDPLVYSVTGLIGVFMTFTDHGDNTASLVLDPKYNHAGPYTVHISVGDGLGGVDSHTLAFTVQNVVHDTDGDTFEDEVDNCPSVSNASQSDWDADDTGDACDGQYTLRFGSASNFSDSDGNTWKAMTATTSGGTVYSVTPTAITGITDPPVCQTLIEARSSNTGKDIIVTFNGLPSGSYKLNLFFAETRTSRQGDFDIYVEGSKKVSRHQPVDFGYKVAHMVTTTATTISDGTLNLLLDRMAGIPSLCALEIVMQ